MRLHLTFLLLAVLLLPTAPVAAHTGSQVPDLLWASTRITPEDPTHMFPMYHPPALQRSGDLVLVTVINEGPDAVDLDLLAGNSTVQAWSLPPDGAPHAYPYVLLAPTNLTLQFQLRSAASADGTWVAFMFDATENCTIYADDQGRLACHQEALPFEYPGSAAVFSMDVTEAGRYRTAVPDVPAHDIEVAAWTPDFQHRLAVSSSPDPQGTTIIEWQTEEAGRHHIVVTSLKEYPNVYFAAYPPASAQADTIDVIVVTEGPLGFSLPSVPTPLLVAVFLALATALRHRGA